MKNIFKYCLGTIGAISLAGLVTYINAARSLPIECSNLVATTTVIESTGIVCLQNVKVSDHSGTQFVKASLQWVGATDPNKFKLISVEPDTAPEGSSPSFSTETNILSIPTVDIPKTYGTERYVANFISTQENSTYFFELTSASIYINPDYIPNETWKPYGMLGINARHNVDLLGRSLPYAKIADAVYSFDNTQVDTWVLIEQKSKNSGMQAGVYSDQNSNALILAFRGTETCEFPCSLNATKEYVLDVAADSLLTIGKDGPQFQHALDYAQEVINRYQDREIIVTGHSLGGGLAQAVGAVLGLETFVFNSAPVPNEFFENNPPPFSSEELSNMIHVIADIHDPVSNTDETGKFYLNAKHISSLIQFDFDKKEIMPDELAKIDELRFNRHGMTQFVDNASSLLTIYREGW